MSTSDGRARSIDEAVDWFVRLRDDPVSVEERVAHAEWLAAAPENARAYEALERDWHELGELGRRARPKLDVLNLAHARSRRRRTLAIGGLSVAAAVVAGVLVAPLLDPTTSTARFETVKAEQRRIALQDGSRMHLNTDSLVDVRFTPETRVVTLARGEGLFDVNHDPRRPFTVRAGMTRVIAVGTRFAVHLDRGEVTVTVVEGRVAIMPTGAAPGVDEIDDVPAATLDGVQGPPPGRLLLEPERQARLGPDGRVKSVGTVVADNVTAWRTGRLVFDNAPLREVARELSRYSPTEVRVAPGVPNHPVTGIIQIRSAGSMVDLLSAVVPVHAVRESPTLTVLYGEPRYPDLRND